MSLSAAFFGRVQAAGFYADLHAEAVALLPEGRGRTWLDVGSGPGLVARLARRRGYEVLGVDRDAGMVRAARRRARGDGSRFEVGDLGSLPRFPRADVVSAASLLFVLPDPAAGLKALWDQVAPGGHLLVVETTAEMDPAHARALGLGRQPVLALWARARAGRALDRRILEGFAGVNTTPRPLLGGLVEAWIFARAP